MSEKTKGEWTRGPYKTEDGVISGQRPDADLPLSIAAIFHVINYGDHRDREITAANAALIAAAFNSATEVEAMGLDGMEAIRALPEIIHILEPLLTEAIHLGAEALDYHYRERRSSYPCDKARALLARLKGGSHE